MRTLVFNIDTAEGHSHRMQLRAYQSEKVYFSKTEVDKDGNRKNDVKEVKGMSASYWCNIVKYILRFQKKNGVEDLKKAKYYLEKLIEEELKE